ncbi:hypothetical protein H6P81_020718 [Aristolochia fimbriata]|uniref:Uncharacterized protein n=1 Tax=Aristolochia fimbriata TaxID=158543 RepID=A0AAV7DZH3_ARIFI|nr:hypothetical protein H6P81_020718 [Aristolochia fimbriata]
MGNVEKGGDEDRWSTIGVRIMEEGRTDRRQLSLRSVRRVEVAQYERAAPAGRRKALTQTLNKMGLSLLEASHVNGRSYINQSPTQIIKLGYGYPISL